MTTYNRSYGDSQPISDQCAKINLVGNAEVTYTVPGDASVRYRCLFSWLYDSAVWVGYNVAVVLPSSGASSSAYNQELRPAIRYVKGGDVLHFLSRSNVNDIGLSLLVLP